MEIICHLENVCVRVYWGALLSTLLCCFPGEKVGFKGDLKQMLRKEGKLKKKKKERKGENP